jgi:hypothetical protein
VDPTGHFSEGAIWNHIYSDICASDMACTYNTRSNWQQDTGWWEMLLLAEAGDVIYGMISGTPGGRHDGAFFYAFEGEGKSKLTGIRWSSNPKGTPLYRGGQIVRGTTKLEHLFTGSKPGVNGNYNWGGLFKSSGGQVVDIFHRVSVSQQQLYQQNRSANFVGGAAYSFATSATTTGLCSLIGSPAGGAACSILASTATGTAPSFFSGGTRNGDGIVT